jgi:hypothetical protein
MQALNRIMQNQRPIIRIIVSTIGDAAGWGVVVAYVGALTRTWNHVRFCSLSPLAIGSSFPVSCQLMSERPERAMEF